MIKIQLNNSKIIEKYIELLGRPVTIIKENEESIGIKAVVENTWTRIRYHFEEHSSKIGRYSNVHYQYIGPASFNILELSKKDYLEIDGEKYCFTNKEAVKIGEEVQYYKGVLKSIGEEDEDVFIFSD